MKVRIVGIGSPAGDDQAGWLVVDALRAHAAAADGFLIEKRDRPGAALLTILQGEEHVILIDAMRGGGAPGTIRRFDERDWTAAAAGLSSHGFGVLGALALAQALGGLPRCLEVYGIEIAAADPLATPGRAVQTAAQRLAEKIVAELGCTPSDGSAPSPQPSPASGRGRKGDAPTD